MKDNNCNTHIAWRGALHNMSTREEERRMRISLIPPDFVVGGMKAEK
jgi:hypothetical protein